MYSMVDRHMCLINSCSEQFPKIVLRRARFNIIQFQWGVSGGVNFTIYSKSVDRFDLSGSSFIIIIFFLNVLLYSSFDMKFNLIPHTKYLFTICIHSIKMYTFVNYLTKQKKINGNNPLFNKIDPFIIIIIIFQYIILCAAGGWYL